MIEVVNSDGSTKEITKRKVSNMKMAARNEETSKLLGLAQTSLESLRSTGYLMFLELAKAAIDELYDTAK